MTYGPAQRGGVKAPPFFIDEGKSLTYGLAMDILVNICAAIAMVALTAMLVSFCAAAVVGVWRMLDGD